MPRLIDADELYVDARCGENEEPYISLYQINDAPTVDAEPVRHGQWEGFHCSVCGETGWDNEDKYCPNCGAKMDAPTQKSVGNALEALEATDETNSMKPYRDEEGHWAIDSNPYRPFEQYAKERDFVEVVRCKDCIYQAECAFTEWLGRNGNGFCSCGERKEDELLVTDKD